jgi:hypothetical protein
MMRPTINEGKKFAAALGNIEKYIAIVQNIPQQCLFIGEFIYMLLINLNRYRAFFNYITGGPKLPPQPPWCPPPPLNHFALPPVKVLFL